MPSTQTDRLKGLTTSVAVKAPILVASTGNLTLSATQTVDGIAVSTGDRVLAWSQTTVSENGIYVVDSGSWARAADFDGSRDVVRGTMVKVSTGTTYGNTWFGVTSTGNNIPGTDDISFAQEAGLAAGAALTGVLDTSDYAINLSEGTAVASSAATNIWATDGNTVHVTGTTTITSLGEAPRIGAYRKVIFDSALTLTHDSTVLVLPGSANIVAAAGDAAEMYADSTTQIRCTNYTKASGRAVIRTQLLETVSSAGAVITSSGITVLSTDSTSGTTPFLVGVPSQGLHKEIHLQTSATLITFNTTATTIKFNTTSAVAAAGGSTTLSVANAAAAGIGGVIVLRGLSATAWAVVSQPASMTVSS